MREMAMIANLWVGMGIPEADDPPNYRRFVNTPGGGAGDSPAPI
jgi:hypothetical protein